MQEIIADISISLDGFVTGPDPDLEHGLGVGEEPLHTSAVGSDDPVDVEVLRDSTGQTGAVVMGRRLFDIIDGPNGWNDQMAYGAGQAATPPVIVVTHEPPATTRLDGFTFVTDGIASAIDIARTAAAERNVLVMGGGDVVRQCVDLGLADELRLHVAPVLLGAGTALFTGARRRHLTARSARWSPNATHLVYDLS